MKKCSVAPYESTTQFNSSYLNDHRLFVQHNAERPHRKVLLERFHLSGHSVGFYLQSQTNYMYLLQSNNKQYHRNVVPSSFHAFDGQRLGFHSRTQ